MVEGLDFWNWYTVFVDDLWISFWFNICYMYNITTTYVDLYLWICLTLFFMYILPVFIAWCLWGEWWGWTFFSEVNSVSDLFFTRIYCERWRGGFDPYESVEGDTNAESYATVEWTYSERYMMPEYSRCILAYQSILFCKPNRIHVWNIYVYNKQVN